MPKATMTPAEAARALNIGRNFLYDLIASGKLEAKKEGKQWRIPERSVQERREQLAQNDSMQPIARKIQATISTQISGSVLNALCRRFGIG
jgi:excisionase family DNA binding protein